MNWTTYTSLFEEIISKENTTTPYDNENYYNYVSLNHSRQNRWLKRGAITEEFKSQIENISEAQEWILITEPWCGDAAHLAPFIQKASELNDNINLTINLRDGEDSLIQDYLTNGKSMSIPILVVRNKNGTDLFSWGPRPSDAQAILARQKEETDKTPEEHKIEFQGWYNKNKGVDVQNELLEKFKSLG
jgi:hypothetical protein